MNETAQVPESIYFVYGGDSDEFVEALEFIGLSPINREFGAFLLSDLGRTAMTQNKLSINVESGDIFYDNHNTSENFYSFLLSQQNDEAAYIPKNISYKNSFEAYIGSFLQSFSIDDQEKFDLLAFKNSKYLFYRFNDFIKVYGNPRYRLLHANKMLDSVGIKKIEEKNKQFLIEKIIHVEFENLYATDFERKPEIMSTIGRNYRIARRVYQQLYIDTAEFFADFIRSLSIFELQDLDEDIRANGWGIKKISEIQDSEEVLKIFQDFYSLTSFWLPLSNSLLVVPDGDAPLEEKLNMTHLYEMFKNTNSHGIVSLPFLKLIQYYLEENDQALIKNALSELYYNLSYLTLSGARDFRFDAISKLTSRLSILLKHATLGNKRLREIENENLAKKINEDRIFEAKIEDPLDEVIEIIDDPDIEHKTSMFP